MDTLKTAVVVVLLLAVLYGVYVFLNQNEQMPVDMAWPDPQGASTADVNLQMPHADQDHTGHGMDAASGTAAATAVESPATAGAPSWSMGADANSSPAAIPMPETDLATAAYPGSSPASTATSISAPALLDAGSTPAPSAYDSATSALPTASAYTPEPPPLRNADSPTGASQNVGDSSPASDRSGGYSLATDIGSELPAETAAASPRYGDPVAPIVSPQEASPANDDIGPIGESPLQGVIRSVRTKIDAGEWYEALFKLSLYYGREDLSDADRKELLDLLDPLAGKVIYSNEHLIEAAYQVQGNETLQEIAQRHNVPWQLLANINAIQNPQAVAPGTQLKIVRGPFHVDISTSRNELTLYAGKLYAGRFQVALGNNPTPQPGEYRVADKLPGRTYYANGQTIAVGDPANPYGAIWIDLGNDVGIHGSGSVGPSTDGCIGLSATDANDLYGILSKGSSVVIRR